MTDLDTALMDRALVLARAQLGRVAPNPAVGCVITVAGVVVAEGVTGDGGRPHAEEAALAVAGTRARKATVYVTLEPCARRSTGTASCAQRLVDAGVRRVVVACRDPHPNAAGEGLELLHQEGVRVEIGLRDVEAEALNVGFFSVVRRGRPWLAIDTVADTYDASLSEPPAEEALAQLSQLAKQGVTRLRLAPDSPHAAAWRASGLVDVG